MARTYFYATPEDQLEFREYAESLGLKIYPFVSDMLGRWKTTNKIDPGGYITFQEIDDLHIYNHPKDRFLTKRISHAKDPLIFWVPSRLTTYQNENYIIHGDIEFEIPYRLDYEEKWKQGKAYFTKLQRWIYKNWPPRQKRGLAIGKEAQKLVQYKRYLARGLPPDVQIQYIKI
jgi:hypothetical protein